MAVKAAAYWEERMKKILRFLDGLAFFPNLD